jgi:hypothetical protein
VQGQLPTLVGLLFVRDHLDVDVCGSSRLGHAMGPGFAQTKLSYTDVVRKNLGTWLRGGTRTARNITPCLLYRRALHRIDACLRGEAVCRMTLCHALPSLFPSLFQTPRGTMAPHCSLPSSPPFFTSSPSIWTCPLSSLVGSVSSLSTCLY